MLLNDTKCFATVISTMETRLLSISKASPTCRMHTHVHPDAIHPHRDD